MDKKIHTLIIPDVHGRTFWEEPVKQVLEETDAHIIFLGDYHDPYPYEWGKDEDYRRISIDRFKEIIELKRANPDRITLLIGNHDCGYAIGNDICSSRMDYLNKGEIEGLFFDNTQLFQLAAETDINGKHFVFSHAGILRGWAERVFGKDLVESENFNVVDNLNNAWLVGTYGILDSLGDYDRYRGWGGYQFGSPVWSDIRSWVKTTPEETYGFNIVGHTQCEENPVIFGTIADLDCRRAFYLDEEGNIRDYGTDDIQEPTKNPEE